MVSIELGDKVRDEATGFEGTVTALAQYLSGTDRAQVSGHNDKGEPLEWWFDLGRLTKQ